MSLKASSGEISNSLIWSFSKKIRNPDVGLGEVGIKTGILVSLSFLISWVANPMVYEPFLGYSTITAFWFLGPSEKIIFETCFIVENIVLASGIFDIVFSPAFKSNFPSKFFVAKPIKVINKTKKIAARKKIKKSEIYGATKSGNLMNRAGVKLTKVFNHLVISTIK